jgi:hypothetical protein
MRCFILLFPVISAFLARPLSITVKNTQRNAVLEDMITNARNLFGANDTTNDDRSRLKTRLLQLCRDTKLPSAERRSRIEAIMAELAPLSPVQATARSPLLQRDWQLVWTTEKEINFFLDQGFSNDIRQEIAGNILTNNIAFTRGGYLSVTGKLRPEFNGVRTYFEFDTATLDIGWMGTYTLPPVGKGWFDTLYLDEALRVDTNSRNDILICQARKSR